MSGRTRGWAPDIAHPKLAIEVKSRKRPLATIVDMLDQAEKARDWAKKRDGKDRLAVGIYHADGTHFDSSYVFLRLSDFLALGLHE